ncbi:hypothetical protein K449DRAFT_439787 [Hypoxylon sp. EC38]|nr:hypothetical protein K449DRAFT_439787 [Hypoxylon sp. EC38]
MDPYMDYMTRHPSEVQRLNKEFDLLTKNIGYLLHRSVAASLPNEPRIADIGTGTGKFLLRLQKRYPNAILDGFDISPALYPPWDTLPWGMTLSVLDAKQPFPEELHNKYDVVHVRMLVAAMLPNDWHVVVGNLFKLLKPGGFLQWAECDYIGAKYLRNYKNSPVDTARSVANAFTDALRERFENGWCTLPRHMREAGFVPVVSDIVSSDRVPKTRKELTINAIKVIFSWARLMTERGAPNSMTMDHLERLEDEAYRDIESGCYLRYDIYVTRGRKPFEE